MAETDILTGQFDLSIANVVENINESKFRSSKFVKIFRLRFLVGLTFLKIEDYTNISKRHSS